MSRIRTSQAKMTSSFSDDELANLTSKQAWDILTSLLYKTTLPLAKTTTFTLDILFTILTSTSDQRRKISILSPENCLKKAYSLLYQKPEVILKTIIFDMGVERWVIDRYVDNYLSGLYVPKQIEIDDDPYFSNAAIYRHTKDSFAIYNQFRERLSLRFLKLSNSQAARNQYQKNQFGLTSDKGDNENNYFLSVLRALDKLYPSKGTLANYVMLWLSNSAGSSFTLYTGEAFNLARPVRKQIHDGLIVVNNKAHDLETAMNIPVQEESALAQEENSQLFDVLGVVQSIPLSSLTWMLHGFATVPTPLLKRQLENHLRKHEGIDMPEVHLLTPDIDELPTILPLGRAPRKDTEHQRRIKEIIRQRKSTDA